LTIEQSTGIGYAIVEQLTTHGAKVYLGARSEERAKAAIKKIEDAHPQVKEEGRVLWLKLDLTEPVDVIESAKVFMGREQKLDILSEKEAF
jgi:NAD(P)-dependent dehydrogenase (short-subunit alcohol dehydrogenase family)